MRIIVISFVTPASENIRGTSALPYHLIKGSLSLTLPRRKGDSDVNDNGNVDSSHEMIIYSFNSNKLTDEKTREVEKELGVTIKLMPLPRWYQWMFKFHLLFLRIFMKYPFVNYILLPQSYVDEIKASQPDMIWAMGEELSRIVKQFPNQRRIQIGPDTESLYYYRMMGRRFVMNNPLSYWKCAMMYRKYARMEREFYTDANFTYYAVGEEDVKFLKNLNPNVNAKFLRHPHYEVRDNFNEDRRQENFNFNVNFNKCGHHENFNFNVNFNKCGHHENDNENGTHTDNKSISKKFHSPKIKLLIAGQYNLYMKQEADLLIEQISVNDNFNFNFNKDRLPLAPSNLEGGIEKREREF